MTIIRFLPTHPNLGSFGSSTVNFSTINLSYSIRTVTRSPFLKGKAESSTTEAGIVRYKVFALTFLHSLDEPFNIVTITITTTIKN
jgi:hypothetical protein